MQIILRNELGIKLSYGMSWELNTSKKMTSAISALVLKTYVEFTKTILMEVGWFRMNMCGGLAGPTIATLYIEQRFQRVRKSCITDTIFPKHF